MLWPHTKTSVVFKQLTILALTTFYPYLPRMTFYDLLEITSFTKTNISR